MARLIGSVDDRGRPLVRLSGEHDDLLLTVDTGFNGDLFVSRFGAQMLGLTPTGRATAVELGDGSTAFVEAARITLVWLGESRPIRVLVTNIWKPPVDDVVGLLGTGLLSPHRLVIDFTAGTVDILTGTD